MSALFNFNHDGPVEVNQADFDTYKTLFKNKEPSFDALFFYWFDEAHIDGVRRLAIRDLCRQSFDSAKAKHAHYYTNMGLGRLVNVLRQTDPKDSSARDKSLSYRPKLLNELVEEFLYAFQNGYINDRGDIDELVQYLIPLVDKTTGQQLFACHSRWVYPYPDKYIEHHTQNLLENVINEDYPEWLRRRLWEDIIKKYCESEIANLKTADLPTTPVTLSHIRFCHYEISVIALYTVSEFTGRCTIYRDKKDFTLITEMAKFLEDNLPTNIAYIYADFQMIEIAPYLTDNTVMFNYIRRHILVHPDKTLDNESYSWLHFLYWARGMTTYAHPDDTELLTEIDRCLTIITTPAE